MKRILYTALLLNIVILSCKNSAEEAKVDGNNSESIRRLVVDFSFKTDQEDKFRIMMNNIVVDEFQQKNIQFSEDVPPSSSFENFHAEFDAYNMSNNVVINLGNKSLKNVENFGPKTEICPQNVVLFFSDSFYYQKLKFSCQSTYFSV